MSDKLSRSSPYATLTPLQASASAVTKESSRTTRTRQKMENAASQKNAFFNHTRVLLILIIVLGAVLRFHCLVRDNGGIADKRPGRLIA